MGGTFPRLAGNPEGFIVTSPVDRAYNCVAWVLHDKSMWWQPGRGGFYWPKELDPDDDGPEAYLRLMRLHGFSECPNGDLEEDVEKICLYFDDDGEFSHVAMQVEDGWWSSKLGQSHDISHERLSDLYGGRPYRYGERLVYMSRPRRAPLRPKNGLLIP